MLRRSWYFRILALFLVVPWLTSCSVAVGPQPTLTATPPALRQVDYEQVGFSYDVGLATDVKAETIPERTLEQTRTVWDAVPRHLSFTLLNTYLGDREQALYRETLNLDYRPKVLVYPVADYARISGLTRETILRLANLLDAHPQTPEGEIPVLPLINGTQILHAQVKYLSFQNGKGVRFITQYTLKPRPINNLELFYTFQGVTSDGAYYVAAFFPLRASILPEDNAIEDYEAFLKQYDGYLAETAQALDRLEAFEPDLARLDALIQSLHVKS